MSIYEYKCKACGHTFKDVGHTEGKEIICPSCTSDEVERADLKTEAPEKGGCSGPRKSPFR
ncbi:MAG TPA: FmdB family zinc ribbon protein [Syntrophorhabdaceae bacterium]